MHGYIHDLCFILKETLQNVMATSNANNFKTQFLKDSYNRFAT